MGEFKLLIVEDSVEELEVYRATLKRYQQEKKIKIVTCEANSKEIAISKLDNSFSGAIVDLNLAGKDGDGNGVIAKIIEKYRIPVAVMTGTPGSAVANSNIVTTYTKGEDPFDKVLDDLFCVYRTGLTKIMGGRGIIEGEMDKIFWQNILPNFKFWKEHVKNGDDTEKALLRYIISHLQEILDDDLGHYYIREMYISPPIHKGAKTGSIVRNKEENKSYVVLSPSCDLAIRKNGEYKTDKILISKIDDFNVVKDLALSGIGSAVKKKRKLEELLKNNYTNYYHWLPSTIDFSGGFINFRWSITITKDVLDEKFDIPTHQVSSMFTKDIISRFGSYYARQGQPDFDFSGLSENLVNA